MSTTNLVNCPTFEATLFVSGPYDKIKEVCQEFCLKGFCVSIKKVEYTYTMGCEEGAEVTLINYPRFPSAEVDITEKALQLGEKITISCHQGSFTLVCPSRTYFWSRREGDKV